MNWGTGIVIFFIVFAISMVSAVVATTKHPPQMVQKDYYALDLNYQERIEKKQNTAALATAPQAQFDADGNVLRVQFPEGASAATGSVKCYRSATTREDVVLPLENLATLNIPAEKFSNGRWHLELDWQAPDGKKYFWETTVFVAK